MGRKLPLILFLLFASFSLLKAQSQYRSPGTGVTVDLGSAANWQSSTDGTNWSTAIVAPNGTTALPSGSTITIQAGDTWQNNVVTTGNVVIPSGVTLTINSNAALGTFSTTSGHTITLSTGSTLVFAGAAAQLLPAANAFTSDNIANLTINNPTTVSTTTNNYVNLNGVLTLNAGVFNCNSAGNTFYLKGTISPNGGLLNASGYFTMNGTVAQSIVGTEFSNGQIYSLTVNSGTGGSASTTGALKATSALNITNGTFALGGALTITGGTMTVGTGGAVNTQNNMVLLSGTAAQNIAASFFSGNNVNNLTIGNSNTGVTSAGSLNIGTSYTVTPLKAGVTPLTITGTATIGGTLTIGSFATTPISGQQFTVLSATAVSGTFAGVTLPVGYTGTLAYTATSVTLTVTPTPSNNANLSALTSTAGTLSPAFDPNTFSYTATVPNATTSVTVTPTAQVASATIKVNGTAVASSNASGPISLNVGNNAITIALTAQDGVTTKTYTLTVTRQSTLYSFDTGVPANFTTTAGSTLTSSTAHIKSGHSLAWNVTNGTVLTASSLSITSGQTGSTSSATAQFYIYNAVPSQDTLVFSFYTNGNPIPQRVGHMLLNFAGWRDYHRNYRYDYDNGRDIGSGFALDQMTITYKPANPSAAPTIYLDEFNMVGDANERQPGPHMQLDLNQFSSSGTYLQPLQYFLNPPPTTSPAATGQEQTDAATIQSRYPRSIPTVTAANVTAAENYVTGCGISRNADGSITGTRGLMYLNNLDTLVQMGNYVGYLTQAAVKNNDAAAKSNLLLFTEYLLDQGLAEGGRNSVRTNDYSHAQSLPVGFLQVVKSGMLTDTLNKGIIKMLKWSTGYNIIYNTTGNQWVETDFIYLNATFLLELAGYTSNVNDQVRDYYANSNFLGLFSNTKQGAEDGFKPDGTTFHHSFNNVPYMYALGTYADRVNSLKGTVFRIKQQAFNNMAHAFKTLLLQQSPGAALLPVSLSGRHPFTAFTELTQSKVQEIVAVGGDIEGTTMDIPMAQLYNYIYQTNYYNVPAASFDSVYHYNYAQYGIRRKGNWTASIKGFTNNLIGSEIYSSANRYGRYQNYGIFEVLYNGGNAAIGWIANGAGWDWNMYPGTTTEQLSWASLQPNGNQPVYIYQTNSFAGALSLGAKHGIFAMDFQEKPIGWYTINSGLRFKKSVFVFDNIMLCLGTSISATDGSGIISTNLFQAIDTAANFAPIYVNSTSAVSGATYSNTLSTSSGSAWMVTGQTTGYYIPKNGGTVTVARGSQTTPDQSDYNETVFHTANYSKAYISHGTKPSNATYQYVVVPGTTPAAMQTLAASLDSGSVYSVLKQTDSLHAVFYKPDSVTSYAFFQPNSNVNIGYVKSISNKALLGIRKNRDTLIVTVNNPDLNVVTDASDAVDQWHSTPQNINLVLNGNWTVMANNSNASITSANNTLTAGFTLKDGLSGSIILVVSKPPMVSITQPAKDTTVATASNLTITANASSPNRNGSIAKVDFYNGRTLLGTSTASPYSYTWNNLSTGKDTLKAVATDNIGLTDTSSNIVITVAQRPVVTVTAPANNSYIAVGSNLTINANASSPNTNIGGSIAKIDFYNGSTLLGTSTTAPYSYTLNNLSAGTDTLKAVATDNVGLIDTSANILITVSQPPTVTVTAPVNNSTVAAGSSITINANASSPNTGGSIAKVDFYSGSTLLGNSTISPYSYTWSNASVGTDTLKAVATDNNGLTATSNIVITVAQPPVVTVTSPANNSTVEAGSNVTINVNTSGGGGSIAKVDFYNGHTLLATSTVSPYSYTWNNLAAGTDTLKAVTTDSNGLTTTSSNTVITVAGLPTASITTPANNSIVTAGSNVTITADASSPNSSGSITKIDFYSGSTLLGTSTAAPYRYTWNSVPVGTYALTIVATDNNGFISTSAVVNIQAEVTAFGPNADAFVRGGEYANANYGTATTLVVKNDRSANYRESYLRFNYSGYTGSSVGSAILKLYVSAVDADPSRVISVYGVPDNTWSETGITYNNQPTSTGTLIGNDTINNTNGLWYQLDVTSYIDSQLAAGQKTVSFRLIDNGALSKNSGVTFNSREASVNNPQLVFTPQSSTMQGLADTPTHPATEIMPPGANTSLSNLFDVTAYSNPSASSFSLQFKNADGSAKTDLRVVDVSGRTVKLMSMAPGSDVRFGNELRPGTYFVEVVRGKDRKVLRLIKQ